jgi:hypothetical protein
MAVCGPVRSQLIASSTFDVSDEGWRVGEYVVPSGEIIPCIMPSGGNPGGWIQTDDQFWWTAFRAPASFLGDRTSAFGGTLSFDIKSAYSDNIAYPGVVMGDGSVFIYREIGVPGADWETHVLTLNGSGGWRVTNSVLADLGAATDAHFLAVLKNLTLLHISADWHSGIDDVGLDNVFLRGPNSSAPVPEPGAVTTALAGAAVFGAVWRRRLRRG